MSSPTVLAPADRRRAISRPCRVVIVEDHTAILEMMRSAVEELPSFKVVGYATDLPPARELCLKTQPDIVILDLVLPSGSGLAFLSELRTIAPGARAIIFSGNLRAGSIRTALLTGAHGLVEKTASLEEFHQALRSVGAGEIYFSRFASEAIRKIVDRRPGQSARWTKLTEREKVVLRGIAEGLSSREIAERLGISQHTVVNHRSRVSRKTGIRGVAQFARYAVQIGLVADTVDGAADAV